MTVPVDDDAVGDHPAVFAAQDLAAFVAVWSGAAAILLNRYLTVTASTPLAQALFPTVRAGDNLARHLFLGLDAGADCAQDMGGQVVAALQATLGDTNDEELRRIVGELSTMSRDFSTAWAHGAEHLRSDGVVRVPHPAAGSLVLRYQFLTLPSAAGDVLVLWQGGDPASESALRQLALTI